MNVFASAFNPGSFVPATKAAEPVAAPQPVDELTKKL